MKPSILFVMHMPGPIHGASLVGKYIHDSEMVNEAFDCRYINMTTAKNLEDIGKGGLKKYGLFFLLLMRVAYYIIKYRPDMVYCTPNSAGAPFYKDWVLVQWIKLVLCLTLRRRKTRVVLHFHNKGVATRQDRRVDDWLYRRFFHNVKLILLAEPLYADVQKYVRREDVCFCPNGIPDVSEYHRDRGHGGPVRLLFLSNLLVAKGVWVLLDALKKLKDKGLVFSCEYVGGETAEIDGNSFAKEVDARGLSNEVRYVGKRYGKEKEESFRRADVFILPSFTEAFPLTVLEAMQYGIPVVATNVGGIPAQVQDGVTGLLCKVKDADSLADKLQWMIEHPTEREAMGEAGRRHFEEHFTLDAFEKKFVKTKESLT